MLTKGVRITEKQKKFIKVECINLSLFVRNKLDEEMKARGYKNG